MFNWLDPWHFELIASLCWLNMSISNKIIDCQEVPTQILPKAAPTQMGQIIEAFIEKLDYLLNFRNEGKCFYSHLKANNLLIIFIVAFLKSFEN